MSYPSGNSALSLMPSHPRVNRRGSLIIQATNTVEQSIMGKVTLKLND